MFRILLACTSSLIILTVNITAQSTSATLYRIDKSRLLWHDKVDREQKRLMGLDGKEDNLIIISKDETVNSQIEYALIKGVDELQEKN